jgi:hypothetical protein
MLLFFDVGVLGSRTGILIAVAACALGSSTGKKSVLSSVDP